MTKIKDIFLRFFKYLYLSYIPNKKDSVKQIIIKVLLFVCIISLVVSSTYIANYFLEAKQQEEIIDESRQIWHSVPFTPTVDGAETSEVKEEVISEAEKYMLKENPDFKGWVRISNTKIDNPIYQTSNNTYYLDHNQKKKKSVYGALYFDYKNKITEEETDCNLVVYGHEMKNGSMFGELKKLRNLNFYKENPTVEFSTLYRDSYYKIYAIFVLNADKKDDNGYVYNIYRKKFLDSYDFDKWTREAKERSLIETNVDVTYGDNILTLVTCSNDFENARLVVMAREVRQGESHVVDTANAVVRPNPLYPQKWYTKRGLKKPESNN